MQLMLLSHEQDPCGVLHVMMFGDLPCKVVVLDVVVNM